jgi:catechol 2,3-dioxygenase-like lactoylglutathione lyase family enzyme
MHAGLLFVFALAAQPQSAALAPPLSARADHLALHVSDLDRSQLFYTRYLGLQPMRAPAPANIMRWLQAGSFELHLIGGRTRPVDVPIAVHLALRVQDLDAVIGRLELDKVPWSDFEKNPRATATRRDGIRQLYLQDPDGYWIEVNEVPIPRS